MKPLKDSEYGEKTMESQETQHSELEQIPGAEKEWSEKAEGTGSTGYQVKTAASWRC